MCLEQRAQQDQFQSTLPVRGGTRFTAFVLAAVRISIHPPRVGRDFQSFDLLGAFIQFQSTLPVWGGTWCFGNVRCAVDDFNPPSPCGEGRESFTKTLKKFLFQSTLPVWGGTRQSCFFCCSCLISIHPPRVGRDRRQSWQGRRGP